MILDLVFCYSFFLNADAGTVISINNDCIIVKLFISTNVSSSTNCS